ncbi:hypothetical protein CBR_g50326 [Chara braunii]|uniref:CCHC-type domain-containing protein n=1 Tax=Chara braunii TaxID=69332 RepID=A0A388K5F2_CHABU|nr:hypothetical protein CBR_g50326 [Chara braunii]|eukprot:GBG65284.1 hypothetical protein CBR_g50326 [Chara braunii]
MAFNGNPMLPANHNCYNRGQPGHISRFCPLSDRRLNGAQTSTTIVPAQPLLTVPPASNVGTAVPYYSGYNEGAGGSGLGRRVSSLEEIVGRINSKHEADEAKVKKEREDEDRKAREKEDEERRMKEKKEHEDLQRMMHKEMASKLDKVCEAVNAKKVGGDDEVGKLRAQVEVLTRRCYNLGGVEESKEVDSDEVTKLRAEVEKLKRGKDVASTSAAVFQTTCEAEEAARLRKEHADVKAATDKRLATLEEVIFALQKQCEAAEANADVWRNEALRPSNKRASVAIGHTPVSDAQVQARITPMVPPCSGGRVNIQPKDIVERHQREVELLKEMRAREVKARKESEDEVDRLKNEMARLNTGRHSKGTDLRRKMDEAVVPTTKGKTAVDLVDHAMQRDVFLRAARKELRGKRKPRRRLLIFATKRVWNTPRLIPPRKRSPKGVPTGQLESILTIVKGKVRKTLWLR